MGELWIVLAVSCGLAFLSEKYTFAWNGRPSKVLNYGIVVLLIAYLSLFAGLRTGYNDTYTYRSGYKAMAAFPDILTEFSWRLGDNPGFILLNSLMKAAGFSAQSFVLFRPTNELQKKIGRVIISSDCAHAFGSEWKGKMAGEIGDFSSFSFHAVKNLTTAEGGALTWHLPFGNEPIIMDIDTTIPVFEGETWNEFLYRKCQLFSLHGQNKDALAKTKLGSWEYDVIGPWYKCNMTDIMASLGLAQMERYDTMLQKRQKYVERFNEAFKELNVAVLDHKGAEHCSSHHLYIIRLLGKTREQVNDVITKMAERGIATNVHYKPLPMMTAYKTLGFDIKNFPNAYKMFENTMTLPLNTKMTEEDVEYVIENFVDIVKSL